MLGFFDPIPASKAQITVASSRLLTPLYHQQSVRTVPLPERFWKVSEG